MARMPQGEYVLVRPIGAQRSGEPYTPSVVRVENNCFYDAQDVRIRLEHHKQGVEWINIPA